MSDWEVVSVREDLDSPDGHRWLITYRVPVEYAPDGEYSYSFPKNIANNYAAVFGFDVDDEADREQLFDYVVYMAYINAVLFREGRGDEVIANPFEMPQGMAKAAILRQVEEFKRDRPLREAQSSAARGLAADAPPGVHDTVRADMAARLNRTQISEMAAFFDDARSELAGRGR